MALFCWYAKAAEITDGAQAPLSIFQTHPGAEPYPDTVRKNIAETLLEKGADYRPRTRHLTAEGKALYTNRLIAEDSPYLLQHAHNPINWYPWGEEALAKARSESKVIFLSIGYSTCHWCHVLEKESFEDETIAAFLNENFIAIKVDRERRPDLDEVYMTAAQLMIGRGGWPLNSFLTPDGESFFATIYLPPDLFLQQIERVAQFWRSRQDDLLERAGQVTVALKLYLHSRQDAAKVDDSIIAAAVGELLQEMDTLEGGFGEQAKFPHEARLLFLIDHLMRYDDNELRESVKTTLDAMALGGMYDLVGGGFHRYATDPSWRIPHFEKMLYNQAYLARVYLQAFTLFGDGLYLRVARQTLDFVLREMTSDKGGFYSALDADSKGGEGEYYLWTQDILKNILNKDEYELSAEIFDIRQNGNFEGNTILYFTRSPEDFAVGKEWPVDTLYSKIDAIRGKLLSAREPDLYPLRDEKIITAWNGMMIAAFTQGYEVTQEQRYLDVAKNAAEFLWNKNRLDANTLQRIYFADRASSAGALEDYAHLAEALIMLYDQTGNTQWLTRAGELVDDMLAQFWDGDTGGFFLSQDKESLIVRPKTGQDGTTPSSNAVALRVLGMLARRQGESAEFDKHMHELINAFAGGIQRHSPSYSYLLFAIRELRDGLAGPLQYAAGGMVKARVSLKHIDKQDLHINLSLDIKDGWHINSEQPLSDNLIPTKFTLDPDQSAWQVETLHYPDAEVVQLEFQQEPLAVYQGEAIITAKLKNTGNYAGAMVLKPRLKIQACSDEICLLPEELSLELPVHTNNVQGG